MEVYRQGAVKLLNSLSRSSDVVRLETVDPAKTIIRFNLDDLGWDEADWNTMLAAYPYRVQPDDKLFEFITQADRHELPYVRADWFAFTAAQPGLYDKLLKLPETSRRCRSSSASTSTDNIKKQTAPARRLPDFRRVAAQPPDRAAPDRTRLLLDLVRLRRQQGQAEPVRPSRSARAATRASSTTAASRSSRLPNGFQGYYLNTADGKSLDKGPTKIVRDLSRKDLAVTNGISCMGCHDQGIRKAKDDIRGHVLGDRASFSKDIRDAVEALYPPSREDGRDARGRRQALPRRHGARRPRPDAEAQRRRDDQRARCQVRGPRRPQRSRRPSSA